ncbi:MAG: YcxB family protein [Pseudomonadota bacterium]
MSRQITFDARIEPALFIRASKLKFSTRSLRKVDWGLQVWSFITMMLVMFGLGGAGVVLTILTFGIDAVNTFVIFPLALPVAFGIWHLYHRALWGTMYRQILASPLYQRQMTYRFDDTGFEMATDGASWTISWERTDDAIADAHGLFLYVGGLVYAIPATAMDKDAFDALTQEVEAWMRAAKGDGS